MTFPERYRITFRINIVALLFYLMIPNVAESLQQDSIEIGSEEYHKIVKQNFLQSNREELDYWLQKGEKKGKLDRDTLLLVKVYEYYARKFFETREIDFALDYMKRSYQLTKAYRDTSLIIKSNILLATMYSYGNDDSLAIDYFLEAERLNTVSKKGDNINGLYVNLALSYRKIKDYDRAFRYFKLAKEKIDTNNLVLYSNYHLNIANLYADIKDYKKAQYHGNSAIMMKKRLGDIPGTARSLMTVGYIFLESKKPYMAVNYFEEALEYGKKLNDVFLFQDAYKKLYESYSTLNRHKEALEAHIKYHEIKDSLEDSAKQKEINELKAITRLQSKNESLLKEAEQKRDIEDSLQKQKNITYILLAFVVIALFLGAFIIQLYRQKERFAALLTQRNKEYQSMNLKLKDSNAAKDKFMSILAHDMINPFNAFLGITQFIQRSFNELSKEEIKESINDIAESAKGLYTLLENLLKWGRSQSGRINFSPEHYNLKMLVTGTISVLNTNAMAKNIELVTDVPESVKVFVDPNMITTVIRNLVSNAIKFTPQGGKIKVEAFQSNKITTVSVTDTGMGISESDIKKLFDLSNHHSTVGTSNEKGTGLGLILCKDFVERHGGKIWVESQKGKGSIFTFTLPEM